MEILWSTNQPLPNDIAAEVSDAKMYNICMLEDIGHDIGIFDDCYTLVEHHRAGQPSTYSIDGFCNARCMFENLFNYCLADTTLTAQLFINYGALYFRIYKDDYSVDTYRLLKVKSGATERAINSFIDGVHRGQEMGERRRRYVFSDIAYAALELFA